MSEGTERPRKPRNRQINQRQKKPAIGCSLRRKMWLYCLPRWSDDSATARTLYLTVFYICGEAELRKERNITVWMLSQRGFVRGACRFRNFCAWGRNIYRYRKLVGLG